MKKLNLDEMIANRKDPVTEAAIQAEAQEARETMDILAEMSNILNTGLDRESLSILVSLCEHGVNPEALAAVVKELRREMIALQTQSYTEKLENNYNDDIE